MSMQEILNLRLAPLKNYLVLFYRILRRPTWFKEPLSTNTKWEDYTGYSSSTWWGYVILCLLISTFIFSLGQANGIPVVPVWFSLHQLTKGLFGNDFLETLVKFIDQYVIISGALTTFVMLALFGYSVPFIHMVMRITKKRGSLRCLFKVTIANIVTWVVVQSIPVVFWVFAFKFGSVQNKIWLTSTTYADILASYNQILCFILMFYNFRLVQSVYHVSPWYALIGIIAGGIILLLIPIGILLGFLGFILGLCFIFGVCLGFISWLLYIPLIVWFTLSPFFSQVYQKIVILWNQYRDILYLDLIGLYMLCVVLIFCFATAFCIRQATDERRFSALTILFRKPSRWLFWIILYAILLALSLWFGYKTGSFKIESIRLFWNR